MAVTTICWVLVVLLASICNGQDEIETTTHMTHQHHSTREPKETDAFSFYFDDHSNYLILKSNGYCYFYHLRTAEETIVHTPDGLRNLETQMLHMMTSSNHVAMHGGDHANISKHVYNRVCANEHLIKLTM